ncbi:hypothetical protein BDN72DRAFT_862493 [Pluteus cervinus]|uniref:Uncharacterized protein n=1 Tax=Pluteus cervinus TaxID=181527 RepID=A0ACD3AB05_9AGAR|nr:hypothetical protein BDN72DRAFT_862493 [Pluteus cervinus]
MRVYQNGKSKTRRGPGEEFNIAGEPLGGPNIRAKIEQINVNEGFRNRYRKSGTLLSGVLRQHPTSLSTPQPTLPSIQLPGHQPFADPERLVQNRGWDVQNSWSITGSREPAHHHHFVHRSHGLILRGFATTTDWIFGMTEARSNSATALMKWNPVEMRFKYPYFLSNFPFTCPVSTLSRPLLHHLLPTPPDSQSFFEYVFPVSPTLGDHDGTPMTRIRPFPSTSVFMGGINPPANLKTYGFLKHPRRDIYKDGGYRTLSRRRLLRKYKPVHLVGVSPGFLFRVAPLNTSIGGTALRLPFPIVSLGGRLVRTQEGLIWHVHDLGLLFQRNGMKTDDNVQSLDVPAPSTCETL